jgi:hypothetical protein
MVMLHHVFDELRQLEQGISRQNLSPADVKMLDSGEIRVHSENFTLNPEAQKCLARLIRCPVEFFGAVPVDLRAVISNRLLGTAKLERICVTLMNDSEVIGFSDPKLIGLWGTEVLEATFDAIPEGVKTEFAELEARRFNLTSDVLELDVTTPRASVEVKVGDIVAAGISIYHSSSGMFATQISTYLHRLACKNGMLVPVCRNDKRLRIRRLDGLRFSKKEMLENIRRISQIAWDELDFKLQALAELTNNKVDAEAVLADLVKRMHLNKKVGQALRQALHEDELGVDESQLGVINALSRGATHYSGRNRNLRRRLMEASGVLSQEQVHRCPTCLSIIRGRTTANF